MAKLQALVGLHLAGLLLVLRVALSAPAANITDELEMMSQVFSNADYEDEDVFIPLDNKQSFDAFDWKLCNILASREPGNVVVSPISIKLLLAMLYEGAVGSTAKELEVGLDMTNTRPETRNKFSTILDSLLAKQPEFVLDVATRIYVHKNANIRARFSKIVKAFYDTEVEKLDFKQTSQAVQVMNSWVNTKTHGRIKSMFEEDAVSPDVLMVMLNTIYFKGLWRYPFNENATKTESFTVSPTLTVTTPFMSMERLLYHSESVELDSKILRLPYMGKKYSMFIVLPNKLSGFDKLMKTVSPALLRNQMFHMEEEAVSLKLPKFSFEYTTELEDVLKEVGIHEIFEEPDLSGIVQAPNKLSVSKIFQKAGLDVNEKGTTAFASTGLVIGGRLGGTDVEFYATRPFLFYIMDEKTGTVIFVGKVVNPRNDIPLRARVNDNVAEPGYLRSGTPENDKIQPLIFTSKPVQQVPAANVSANDVLSYDEVIEYLVANNSTIPLKVWTYLNSVLKKKQDNMV